MQAVILAGGLGTRLRPLTEKIPKVMVKVRGTEFLWHLIRWLARNDIKDMVICAAHLWEVIARKVNLCVPQGVRLRLSVEKEPLGTAGAVRNAEALLDEEFLLINGDTYLPISYERILSHWEGIRERFDCLLVVYSNRDKIAPNDTAVNDERVVVGYSKKRCEEMQYVNAGLAVMKKSVFEGVRGGVPVSLEEEVFPELVSRRKIAAFVIHERYYDIGTPERLKVFEEYLEGHPEALSEG
ncbi:NTP transferase domain-containing protein [bacterium]|nr:NTP transferase domain-containing protein [bacterium]